MGESFCLRYGTSYVIILLQSTFVFITQGCVDYAKQNALSSCLFQLKEVGV